MSNNYRRPRRPDSPGGIELSELPPWSGDPSTVRRTGYTPPQVFAQPSLATTAEIVRSTSSLTTSVHSSHAEHANENANTNTNTRSQFHPSPHSQSRSQSHHDPNSPPQLDIITAQIQRALGVHDTTSEIADDDVIELSDNGACALTSTTSPGGGGADGWHDTESLFRDVLGAPTVDVDELRRLIWAHGVPDRPWVRPVAWKLLCNVLPPDRADWGSELASRRVQYWNMVSEYSADPSSYDIPGDHPLCEKDDSRWREHFADVQLRRDIARDTERALVDVPDFESLRDALSRLLFVHSKACPEARYRQGMHELAAPLLWVFCKVPFEDPGDAEADAYFAYRVVMREMAAVYDDDALLTHLRELQALLRIKDPGLEKHLANEGVDMRYFALRWLRLWLAHEFAINDMLGVWDSLLAAEQPLPWLRYVSVAMLIRIRNQLLAGDFAACMKLLLRYPQCEIAELLRIADRLRTSRVVLVRRSTR